jgi:putative peptide maturation system protein
LRIPEQESLMRLDDLPLRAGLGFVAALAAERVDPPEALARLGHLRRQLSGVELELVWDREALADRPAYDLLMSGADIGTVSLALTADGLPFPLRGLQRWREAAVLRVDGRLLLVQDVLMLLEVAWGDTRVLDRLVDIMLLRRELERTPYVADDADLQRGVDDLRRHHGLVTPEATERWLAERGQSLVTLEALVEEQLAYAHLRRLHVGSEARAAFDADPRRWDAVEVLAFPAGTEPAALALRDELRGGGDLLALAARELAGHATVPAAARSIVFEVLPRYAIATLDGGPIVAGATLAARLRGAGPYVAVVRDITPARWNEVTRTAVEQVLFDVWLRERRTRAHVEWNWGPASDPSRGLMSPDLLRRG